MDIFDPHPCLLGEGPLWHPKRGTLIWFDILNKTMFERGNEGQTQWQFDEYVSAAGWVDDTTLLQASASGLYRFDLTTGSRSLLHPLEADNEITRSNDGRADPWGGFWIGTMGIEAQPQAGAIYRYFRGTLRQIAGDITISNAICFAPDRSCAYYTDTPTRQVMRLPLDADGWPNAAAEVFVDLKAKGENPDGAVTDAQGNLWVALWGASKVSCFDTAGNHVTDAALPATQPTCPAFGGEDLRDLLVTSATQGLDAGRAEHDGKTLILPDMAQGLPEPQVIL